MLHLSPAPLSDLAIFDVRMHLCLQTLVGSILVWRETRSAHDAAALGAVPVKGRPISPAIQTHIATVENTFSAYVAFPSFFTSNASYTLNSTCGSH